MYKYLSLCTVVKVKAIGECMDARDRVRLVESILHSNIGPENAIYHSYALFFLESRPHVMYCDV
jgi:hypothetical protein